MNITGDGKYYLVDNITLTGNNNWTPISGFSGVLDGNGKTISGLNINKPNDENVGLFAVNNGTIKNLTLSGAQITGKNYVGAFAGKNNSTIENCAVVGYSLIKGQEPDVYGNLSGDGFKQGSYVGCITGLNEGTIIRGSVNWGGARGNRFVGGIAGSNKGTIKESYVRNATGNYGIGFYHQETAQAVYGTYMKSDADVSTSDAPYTYTGGIAGMNESGARVESCYVVNSALASLSIQGGLIGMNKGHIEKSYAAFNTSFRYEEPYLDTYEYGPSVADFNNDGGTWNGVYCFSQTPGFDYQLDVERTTDQMKQKATYNGWDFESLWTLTSDEVNSNYGYPVFQAYNPQPEQPAVPEKPTATDLDDVRVTVTCVNDEADHGANRSKEIALIAGTFTVGNVVMNEEDGYPQVQIDVKIHEYLKAFSDVTEEGHIPASGEMTQKSFMMKYVPAASGARSNAAGSWQLAGSNPVVEFNAVCTPTAVPPAGGGAPVDTSSLPQTGDASSLMLWLFAASASIAALCVMRKRESVR